ncbi:MAG: hypothetical protein JWL97_4532, partial [Gemmatimonadales bacterium]|nr:hypothetical protein [Gemmatimonadales bacterium]
MSFNAWLWAMQHAPAKDAEEKLVLIALAEHAKTDGTGAYPSQPTMAEFALLNPKTVQRRLSSLSDRGVIAEGDQNLTSHLPADKRPVVWDMQIPYSWFRDIDKIDRDRAERGLPPLTPEMRPDLAPAPERKYRVDKGTKRPLKQDDIEATDGIDQIEHQLDEAAERADYKSPRTTSPPGDDAGDG